MADQLPRRQPSRTSTRQSIDLHSSPSQRTSNVFGDDFSMASLSVNGSPTTPSRDHGNLDMATAPHSSDRNSMGHQSTPDPAQSSRRSFGSERRSRIVSSSRNDPLVAAGPPRTASVSEMSEVPPTSRRPYSLSKIAVPGRTQSSVQGVTGPSHPYGMYPQNTTISRSTSNATQSTVRQPERTYAGASQPTHPYGMYPQSTVPESDTIAGAPTNAAIPVGFTGLGQQYSRRIGPDGEDADDIVGSDGHAEQLPPYTRFPDNKARQQQRAVPTITGENPDPFSSLNTVTSDSSGLSSPTSEDHNAQINTAAAAAAGHFEEPHASKEKWIQRGKKRVCGATIPAWALASIILLLVMFSAIIGGVIGRFAGHKHTRSEDNSNNAQLPDPALQSSSSATP